MKTWPRNAALVLPLLLVNSAAIFGQSLWAHQNLGYGGWPLAVTFAAAIEFVGIYLAVEAHAALMAGHSSGALRIGSYAIGALSGALNYAHFSIGYRPGPLAITFGLLSSISPWLWAIRSRSLNRARLFADGLIDPRAVRFSRLRWVLFPTRTFSAFRLAVWEGTQRPAVAIDHADAARATRRAVKATATSDTPVLEATMPIEPTDIEPATPRPRLSARPSLTIVGPVRRTLPATRTPSATRDEVARRLAADPSLRPAVIAEELSVSKRTVERHVADLRQHNGHRVATADTDRTQE